MISSALSGGVVGSWREFGDLFRGEAPRLAVFAMTLGADPDRAADLTQESLAALWRRWDDVPGTARTFARILVVRAARPSPAAEVPDTDDPAADLPEAEVPVAEVPVAEVPVAEVPVAEVPVAEVPVAEVPVAVDPGAEVPASAGPLRFPTVPRDDGLLTGLAALAPQERQVLVSTFDDLPPEDVAQVLQMPVDLVVPTADAARTALTQRLDGKAVQPAYEELVASIAAGMDLDGGLELISAGAPGSEPESAPAPPPRRPAAHIPDELVIAAMTGDRDAIARLLEVLRPLVARYCRGKLGTVDRSFLSADDVAQEVCLAVLGALPNYRVQGRPFLAFVYGIAAHKVIDAHRAVSRGRSDPVAEMPDVVSAEAGPEQQVMRAALSDQLRDLLEELPEKQRNILVLRIVVGLSAEETAEIVGATPGAVRVAQHRALTRLRKSAPRSLVRDHM